MSNTFWPLYLWFIVVALCFSSQQSGIIYAKAVQSEFSPFQYIGLTTDSLVKSHTNEKLVSGNPIGDENVNHPSSCHGCRSLTEIMDPTCFDITLAVLDSKPVVFVSIV